MAHRQDPFSASVIAQAAVRRLVAALAAIAVLWLCILWAVSLP